jgi:hypothetical protein
MQKRGLRAYVFDCIPFQTFPIRKFMIAETELNFTTRVYFYLKEWLGQEHYRTSS